MRDARLRRLSTSMPPLPFRWMLSVGVPASAATFDWSAQSWAFGVCMLALLLGFARMNGGGNLPDPGSSGAGLKGQRPGNGDPHPAHGRRYAIAGGGTEWSETARGRRPRARRTRSELARVA
ncbi:exported hypothetical protein [Thiocapsa sp. KS1]|nr:exported hypothetical protein [Thiocapsa sp. KS1]